jgi:hypothetical protein
MWKTLLSLAIAAAAGLYAEAVRGADAPPPVKAEGAKRLFPICRLYAVGHFGNSYEVMGENEARDVLAETVAWGFNGYEDWFDTDDCKDPYAAGHTYGLGDAQLEWKKIHYATAQSLGMQLDLTVTPNHVYIDQCLPGLLATKGERVQGQLICPSIPEARAMILKVYENLFSDLARSGVRLASINACPYDYGGCRCEKCKPWILTYARLAHEIYEVARKHHPQVKMDMIGWWWKASEHTSFAEWADREAPGWVDHMYLHLPYGATKVADVALPKGCQRGAFVHISYAEQANPRDMYGHFGPVIAAARLERTVADLKAQGVTALDAYSEGVFDDVNKAILAGLASGQYRTADEVLLAYVERYFGVDAETAPRWVAWLKAWGKPFDVDTVKSAAELADLLKKTPKGGWRLKQWELKQQLFAANREIGTGKDWTPRRLAAVERFWAVQEQIHRGVWGLPPQRHIFGRRYTPTTWYASWAKFKATEAATIGKEQ